MGEAALLAKLVMVIGFLVFFTQLLVPVNGPINFTVTSFPSFNNPFASPGTFTAFTLHPNRNMGVALGDIPAFTGSIGDLGPFSVTNPGGATTNCVGSPPTDWFGCVRDIDNLDRGTFATVGGTGYRGFVVGLERVTGISLDVPVGAVTIHYTCQTRGTQFDTSIFLYDYTGKEITSAIHVTQCPVSKFAYQSFTVNFPSSPPPRISDFNGGFMDVHGEISVDGNYQDFDYASIDLEPKQQTSCTWGDVACAISQGFQFFLNIAVFLVNAVIFIFQWLIVIATFFAAMALAILWFYAIPGMPSVVQGAVDVGMTSVLFMIMYAIAKLVRGSGPV